MLIDNNSINIKNDCVETNISYNRKIQLLRKINSNGKIQLVRKINWFPKQTKVETLPSKQLRCVRTKMGTQFEQEVKTHIENVNRDKFENSLWQIYLNQIMNGLSNFKVEVTKTQIGFKGHTEDLIVHTQKGVIKISCKRNNIYLSHPRTRSFLKLQSYQIEHDTIMKDFDDDHNRCTNMYIYYEMIAQLTERYVKANFVNVFKFLYPSDVHLIHNTKTPHYFPILNDPTEVNTHIFAGSGLNNRSCNLEMTFDNSIIINLRIHNAVRRDKMVGQSNPFKWESSLVYK